MAPVSPAVLGDAAGICMEREGFACEIWEWVERATTEDFPHPSCSLFPTLINFYQCNHPPSIGQSECQDPKASGPAGVGGKP